MVGRREELALTSPKPAPARWGAVAEPCGGDAGTRTHGLEHVLD
jgi:hypothetical protein